MNLQGLAEPESTPVARLVAMLVTDKRLKAEALTTVSGWPERESSPTGRWRNQAAQG